VRPDHQPQQPDVVAWLISDDHPSTTFVCVRPGQLLINTAII
jgi:hypothetical protein